MTPEERDELLTAYALGTLPGPEAAAVTGIGVGVVSARRV